MCPWLAATDNSDAFGKLMQKQIKQYAILRVSVIMVSIFLLNDYRLICRWLYDEKLINNCLCKVLIRLKILVLLINCSLGYLLKQGMLFRKS